MKAVAARDAAGARDAERQAELAKRAAARRVQDLLAAQERQKREGDAAAAREAERLAVLEKREQAKRLQAVYSRGISLYRGGSYEEAIAVFDQLLAEAPGHRGGRSYRAAAARGLVAQEAGVGTPEGAGEEAGGPSLPEVTEAAMDFGPEPESPVEREGWRLGKDAAERARQLAVEREQNLMEWYDAGLAALKAREYAEAVSKLEALVELVGGEDPLYPDAGKSLGEAQARLARQQEIQRRADERDAAMVAERTTREEATQDWNIARRVASARQSMKLGRWETAIKQLEKILEMDPDNTDAGDALDEARLGLDDKGKQLATDAVVLQYMERGHKLFAKGQYAEAAGEWQEVVRRTKPGHPAHKRAASWMQTAQVSEIRRRTATLGPAKIVEQARFMSQVDESWIPPRRLRDTDDVEVDERPAPLEDVDSELDRRVQLHFKDAHIRDVLRYLSDVTNQNIVLDENVFPSAADEFDEGFEVGGSSPRVTIDFDDVPLGEALDFILRAKGLRYRVERNAIWITTEQNFEEEQMLTKVFRLTSGIGGIMEFGEVGAMDDFGDEGLDFGDEVAPSETIDDIIAKAVPQPPGSSLHLDPRTGMLIVTNTPTNMKLVEQIIQEIDKPPFQVMIEAKFVEMSEEALTKIAAQFPTIRFPDWGNSDLVYRGEAELGRAVSDVSTTHLVAPSSATGGVKGLGLEYTKISDTEFQFVMETIRATYGARELSAPKVTTVNQQEASVQSVQEYRFATSDWEVVYWWDLLPEPRQRSDLVPLSFNAPEEYGISLTVTPDVGSDRRTVTLSLTPEVSSFAGWLVYSVDVSDLEEGSSIWRIQEPITRTRNIHTRVVVADGETVVMGGLLSQGIGHTTSGVPILKDLPLVGQFFRSDVKISESRNLLIFVTVQLLTPTGAPLRSDDWE